LAAVDEFVLFALNTNAWISIVAREIRYYISENIVGVLLQIFEITPLAIACTL
jgi:hypothetical protein